MEMERCSNIDEVFDTYSETQKQLWDRWMRIAWRFEVSSTPENAWWAIPYRVLSPPKHSPSGDMSVEEAWIQMWQESVRRREGVFGALIEWNRRILDQQAKANAEFLKAWSEAMHRVGGDAVDAPLVQEFRELNDAIKHAIIRPFDRTSETEPIRSENGGAGAVRRSGAARVDRSEVRRQPYTE